MEELQIFVEKLKTIYNIKVSKEYDRIIQERMDSGVYKIIFEGPKNTIPLLRIKGKEKRKKLIEERDTNIMASPRTIINNEEKIFTKKTEKVLKEENSVKYLTMEEIIMKCFSIEETLDLDFIKTVCLSFHTFMKPKKIIQYIEQIVFEETFETLGNIEKSKRLLTFIRDILYYSYHLFKKSKFDS
jgi:hypothetical protein